MKVIYVSGCYTKGGEASVEEMIKNFFTAMHYSYSLMEVGYGVMSPILNTAYDCLYRIMGKEIKIPYENFLKFDLRILAACDAVFMMPGWEKSKGARMERDRAIKLGMPIYYSLAYAKKVLRYSKLDKED